MDEPRELLRAEKRPKPPPLQFSIRAMLIVTVAVAAVFGGLRWAEVPTQVSAIVLVVLIAGMLAAVALVAAITYSE